MKIVNFGYNRWSPYWKRNQTIFYLLSQMDQVESGLFVNPSVWIAEFVSSPQKLFQSDMRSIFTQAVTDKIQVKTPVYLPYVNRNAKIRMLNNYLNSRTFTTQDDGIILILNNLQADPYLVDIVRSKAKLTIFDWSDDFDEFSNSEQGRLSSRQRCNYYCEKADIVLTINDNLRERALETNKNSHVVKNATNFFTFSSPNEDEKIIRRIRQYGDKVIGYVGWLNNLRLDQELIKFVAEKRPGYQFVFMGPECQRMPLGKEIPSLKNVHILPPVPYEKYPATLKAFDVCILPNIINAHTNGNDPIKIYDYLASGRPIVATKTAGTDFFSTLLYLADSKDDFLNLLDHAVNENTELQPQERIQAAHKNSWQERFVEIESLILPYMEN